MCRPSAAASNLARASRAGIPSGLAVQRATELIQLIVVVPGQERDQHVDGEPPARRVLAAALPVGRLQRHEPRERLAAPPAELRQRQLWILALVLALARPASGGGPLRERAARGWPGCPRRPPKPRPR